MLFGIKGLALLELLARVRGLFADPSILEHVSHSKSSLKSNTYF